METNTSGHVERWMGHIRALATDIGPRGSTTPDERRGAEYCQQALGRTGLDAQIETFAGARSIYQPHLLASIAMLIAFALYPLAGRASAIAAAVISLIALASDLMELSFYDNPLRRLAAKGPSQNVVATLSPTSEPKQDLVLIGHIDSHRTPLIFSTPRWVAIYQAFTTIAFASFVLQVVLYFIGAITGWGWVWPVSIISAVCALLLAAMCIQADSTPFSAGANDNASGAGLVLALAEHLKSEPLAHTRVWAVCTGCEEVQHYGAIDFFRRHKADLLDPKALVFEMLGCAGPAWLVKEGIIVPFHASPSLVALMEELSAAHPEWGAQAVRISGGNTEMADALRVGIPAITLIGMDSKDFMPYWHQVEDTSDKMDPEVMQRAYGLTWAFIKRLDEQAG